MQVFRNQDLHHGLIVTEMLHLYNFLAAHDFLPLNPLVSISCFGEAAFPHTHPRASQQLVYQLLQSH